MGLPGGLVVTADGTLGISSDGEISTFDDAGESCCCPYGSGVCQDACRPDLWPYIACAADASGDIVGSGGAYNQVTQSGCNWHLSNTLYSGWEGSNGDFSLSGPDVRLTSAYSSLRKQFHFDYRVHDGLFMESTITCPTLTKSLGNEGAFGNSVNMFPTAGVISSGLFSFTGTNAQRIATGTQLGNIRPYPYVRWGLTENEVKEVSPTTTLRVEIIPGETLETGTELIYVSQFNWRRVESCFERKVDNIRLYVDGQRVSDVFSTNGKHYGIYCSGDANFRGIWRAESDPVLANGTTIGYV